MYILIFVFIFNSNQPRNSVGENGIAATPNLPSRTNVYSININAAIEPIHLPNELQSNQKDSFREFNDLNSLCNLTSEICSEMGDSCVTSSECQLKTITCEEYEYLKKLPIQVKKLKRSVNKMQTTIRNKNMEIEEIKKDMKRNQNFLKMSTVSLHILLQTFQHLVNIRILTLILIL